MSGVRGTYYPVASLPDTNARIPAMTQRPASTALLTIDSEDRYTDYEAARALPTSPYNFAISKPESLMAGFMTRIGISEVVFPWAIPNINERTLSIIVSISVAGVITTDTIELEVGFHRPAEIAAIIQTQIRALDASLAAATFVYSEPGGYPESLNFSYATNSATTIDFNPLPYNSALYPYPSSCKQLFDLLGFTNANTVYATTGFGRETLCQAVRYIDIVCNQLTNSQAQKDQTSQAVARDMLCRIYLGDAPGATNMGIVPPSDPTFCPPGCSPTVIYRNFANQKQIQWIPNQNIPGFLKFDVYDDAGQPLDELFVQPGTPSSENSYGLDWSMTLLVTEN